jgi:hypothetical protein
MKFSFSNILVQQKEEDMGLFFDTLKEFSRREFISVGSIQGVMKVSYRRARATLDMLISHHFASPQIGARPCKILKPPVN